MNTVPLRLRPFPSYLLRLPAQFIAFYRISRRTSGRRRSLACAWWCCAIGVRVHRRLLRECP